MYVDIAAHHTVVDLHWGLGFVEPVLAGFQGLPRDELDATTQRPGLSRITPAAFNSLAMRTGRVARTKHHEFRRFRRYGHPQGPRQPAAGGQDGKQ